MQGKYGDLAIPLVNRAYVLRNISFVDEVLVFGEEDPSKLIRKLKPTYYVRGPDYRDIELPEASACHEVGTRIVIQPADKIHNSSELIHKLSASAFSQIDLTDF
jgi:D-beta-D-heptose 7-phosphate kinase/D-beta-D-heptose 1-phosphate adenosyltransferase